MPSRKTIVVPCIVNSWLYAPADRNVPFGRASWMRMSSASMPPATKNAIAVVPYMMAIFLWSGVVNQLQTPVIARGRASSFGPRAVVGTGSCVVVMRYRLASSTASPSARPRAPASSLVEPRRQALRARETALRVRRIAGRPAQELRDLAGLRRRHALGREVRHVLVVVAEGLLARRVVHPLREVVGVGLVDAACEGAAVAEVGEVRTDARLGDRLERVACDAAPLLVQRRLDERLLLRVERLLLAAHPRVVVGLRLRDHTHAH